MQQPPGVDPVPLIVRTTNVLVAQRLGLFALVFLMYPLSRSAEAGELSFDIVGAVAVALGLALAGFAIFCWRSLTVVYEIGPDGIRFEETARVIGWSEIGAVVECPLLTVPSLMVGLSPESYASLTSSKARRLGLRLGVLASVRPLVIANTADHSYQQVVAAVRIWSRGAWPQPLPPRR